MQETPEQQDSARQESASSAEKPRLRKLWRRVENLLFGTTVLLVVLYFVLQLSAVQNWLIRRVTGYLSSELKTRVEVRHIDVVFFDNLLLEGFYLEDRAGDTLLYAEKLKAGLNSNIFSLLNNRLEFNEISLSTARFNIRKAEGEATTNLQFLLDYFAGTEPKPKKEPSDVQIKVQVLRLTDVQFLNEDQVNGKRLWASVPNGAIRINNFDLKTKKLDVQSVFMEGAAFTIADYPASPRPVPIRQEKAVEPTPADAENKDTPALPFIATVSRLYLKDARFSLDRFDKSPGRTTPDNVIDYQHLNVQNISIEADEVYADSDLAFRGKLRNLSAREQSGMTINGLQADEVYVCDTLVALYGSRLETNGSVLGDTLALHYSTYRDFTRFTDRVKLEGHFGPGSKVRFGDIMFFSPAVERNSFFQINRDQVVELTGHLDGRINRLNGRDLKIRLGTGTVIHGKFDGNDMAEGSDRMRLLFDFEQVRSNMRTIRKIIPGFSAPQYFDRLGNINFSGTYQILFGTNHILNGDLVTDLGAGNLDMKMDLTGGKEKATYSGFLNMADFDLARWTNNNDFGNSTFQVKIANGSGLTLQTIKSRLTGTVDALTFRGYNYQNVQLNGAFDQAVFDGDVQIEDPNINFVFHGKINLQDSVPQYDFNAELKHLDLGALNLVKQDWVLSGSVNKIKLFAKSWSDMRGAIALRNFKLIQDKKYVHTIDSLTFAANTQPNGDRYFILLSDIADGMLEGQFEIDKMARNALYYFNKHFPELVQQAYGTPLQDTLFFLDRYKINLQIKDTRDLTRLFDPNLDTIRDLHIRANLNAKTGVSALSLQVPNLRYNGLQVQDVDFSWNGVAGNGKYALNLPHALLANGQQLAQLHLDGTAERNALSFALTTEDTTSIVERINLNGTLSTVDSLWEIHFNTSDITLFDEQWFMGEDNYIRFSGDYFEAQNFDLMHDIQRIIVESFNDGKGARFSLANFDLNFLERFFQMEKISYRAKIYNLDLEIYDLFAMKNIQGYITTDTVFINDLPYGSLIGNLEMADLDAPVWCKLFLNDRLNSQLRVLGAMIPAGKPASTVPELGAISPGEFQTHITANQFPMEVLELFIPGISKTSGKIQTDVRIGGPFNRVGMNGTAMIDGHFQLDYMKSMFHIPNQQITLTNNLLWADGDTILDASRKNMAIIKGGLRHDHFKDWRLDCEINSVGSNFLVMNTMKEDNSLYYGQGIGRFDARFTGSFSQTNIFVDAETGKETRLYIPLSSSSDDIQDASFITFIDKTAPRNGTSGNGRSGLGELKGLNFEMNLSITEDAEVQLIFDEQAGDIIRGRGEGDIRLTINREGDFKMYGSYQIRRGDYLFTLLNWVNKPFTVKDGGTINWYGDPYGAQINLDATYAENTSLYNLIRDELVATNNLTAEATKSTLAIVTMHLTGDLFKPNIGFDLSFPNVSSQLKNVVNSKLSLMRQDQNELTRQVFGLVVVGSFLPPSGATTIQSGDYIASAFNTLTQVLSNQFSNYLTALAYEWFGGAVSSIDFDIAYNEYRNQTDPSQANLAQIGRELQVRLTSGFANDRITVQVGSQFGLGQPGTSTADGFLGEDVTIEIQMTENRQWRLKVYQRTEPDIAGGSRRSRYGFGISFRKEYENFGALMDGLTGWFKKGEKDDPENLQKG
ncbi:MAG: hypothetical protein EP344_10215 [Bacteroidetes bacterium]|nr:MAG: hypothetical protein EP344_10215 [Bacteroidota bacterium]